MSQSVNASAVSSSNTLTASELLMLGNFHNPFPTTAASSSWSSMTSPMVALPGVSASAYRQALAAAPCNQPMLMQHYRHRMLTPQQQQAHHSSSRDAAIPFPNLHYPPPPPPWAFLDPAFTGGIKAKVASGLPPKKLQSSSMETYHQFLAAFLQQPSTLNMFNNRATSSPKKPFPFLFPNTSGVPLPPPHHLTPAPPASTETAATTQTGDSEPSSSLHIDAAADVSGTSSNSAASGEEPLDLSRRTDSCSKSSSCLLSPSSVDNSKNTKVEAAHLPTVLPSVDIQKLLMAAASMELPNWLIPPAFRAPNGLPTIQHRHPQHQQISGGSILDHKPSKPFCAGRNYEETSAPTSGVPQVRDGTIQIQQTMKAQMSCPQQPHQPRHYTKNKDKAAKSSRSPATTLGGRDLPLLDPLNTCFMGSELSHSATTSAIGSGRRGGSSGGKQPVTSCHQCNLTFTALVELNAHFLAVHECVLKREFELARSWKSTAVEDMCMQELETVVTRGDTEAVGYQCPHCEYFAKWPTELQKHIMVHSKERPHQCIICGLTYKWKWDLGRHFDKSHLPTHNPYKKYVGAAGGPTGGSASAVSSSQSVQKSIPTTASNMKGCPSMSPFGLSRFPSNHSSKSGFDLMGVDPFLVGGPSNQPVVPSSSSPSRSSPCSDTPTRIPTSSTTPIRKPVNNYFIHTMLEEEESCVSSASSPSDNIQEDNNNETDPDCGKEKSSWPLNAAEVPSKSCSSCEGDNMPHSPPPETTATLRKRPRKRNFKETQSQDTANTLQENGDHVAANENKMRRDE